jgi:hypothetical protein
MALTPEIALKHNLFIKNHYIREPLYKDPEHIKIERKWLLWLLGYNDSDLENFDKIISLHLEKLKPFEN